MLPNGSAKLNQWKAMLVALLAVAVRSPILLSHGRVFAEEGTVYLQQAWILDPLHTLTAVRQGYFSLLMNSFALLGARAIPLEWVGILYTTGALAVLMLTVYLALVCERFESGRTQTLAVAVILLAPAIEVWLTLLDAQFYLPVCVALICVSDERRHRLIRFGTLLLAGLTGPVSCALVPMLVLRAWRRPTWLAWAQAVILAIASVVQAAVLFVSVRTGGRKLDFASKAEWFGPIVFVKVFSVSLMTRLGGFATQSLLNRHPNVAVCLLLWSLGLLSLSLFWRIARHGGWTAKAMFTMALMSLCFNYAGDPAPTRIIFTGEFRYFFTGTVLFWFSILLGLQASTASGDWKGQRLAQVVLGLALVSGLIDAAGYWGRFQVLQPVWRQQVEAWRQDPTKPIRVVPTSWGDTLYLRPC
jgi:hypothetical protein